MSIEVGKVYRVKLGKEKHANYVKPRVGLLFYVNHIGYSFASGYLLKSRTETIFFFDELEPVKDL